MGEKYFIVGNIQISKNKIIIVGNAVLFHETIKKLEEGFEVFKTTPQELKDFLQKTDRVDAVWIHFDTYLSLDYLKDLKDVPILISTTTGLTHVDPEIQNHFGHNLICLHDRKIFLENISATAEHAWSLIMLENNDLAPVLNSVSDAKWDRQLHIRPRQLLGQTIGIIGFGRIGSMVARYARGFNMKVIVNDINPRALLSARNSNFQTIESLSQMIKQSDIVSIHANYKIGDKPLISRELLGEINKSLLLVNTARAGLVDEESIIHEIENRPFLKYYTDVMGFEENNQKLSDSKLWSASLSEGRIKITPHIGGASREAIWLCEQELTSDLLSRQ